MLIPHWFQSSNGRPKASCWGSRLAFVEVAAPTCLRPNVRRPAKGTALSKSQQQDLHPKIPEVLKFQKQMERWTSLWNGKGMDVYQHRFKVASTKHDKPNPNSDAFGLKKRKRHKNKKFRIFPYIINKMSRESKNTPQMPSLPGNSRPYQQFLKYQNSLN